MWGWKYKGDKFVNNVRESQSSFLQAYVHIYVQVINCMGTSTIERMDSLMLSRLSVTILCTDQYTSPFDYYIITNKNGHNRPCIMRACIKSVIFFNKQCCVKV